MRLAEEQVPVTNYRPPIQAEQNLDVQALLLRLAQLEQEVAASKPPAPVVRSPAEQARYAVDNAGAGLGYHEQLMEIYAILDVLARKVGV